MTPTLSSPLRHAVIGVGAGIFSLHRAGLTMEGVQVVGVSDVVPKPGAGAGR